MVININCAVIEGQVNRITIESWCLDCL